jgi:UDP-glucose 6-dehydrogenase
MTDKIKPKEKKLKVGIIGTTPVGYAVNHAFQVKTSETYLMKEDDDYKLMYEWEPGIIFFCQEEIDAETFKDTLRKSLEETSAVVVIKTILNPGEIDILASLDRRVVYFPDIIKEGLEKQHFLNPPFIILGGAPEPLSYVEQVLFGASNVLPCQVHRMSAVEAAFTKMAINSFLAMKVAFFNELYDAVDKFGGNYNTIIRSVGSDHRIGISHTTVPGLDGRRGFAGQKFAKTVEKFYNFTDTHPECQKMAILESVLEINKKHRGDTNVDNGQAEEE